MSVAIKPRPFSMGVEDMREKPLNAGSGGDV
jgi:hypothetical protein